MRRAVRKGSLFWKLRAGPAITGRRLTSAQYWSHVTVAAHEFKNADDSMASFHWRNEQYHGYIDLLPVEGYDGQVVLDYGCGPGNDLVGFANYSDPSRLIGCDVSPKALSLARKRLDLHKAEVDFVQIDETNERLPFEDGSIDYIHSSGVLHHVPDPHGVLREFGRILKPGGKCGIMVYNYDSIWLHLYVAYRKQLVEGKYGDLSISEAFAKTTDGEHCPISRAWRPSEFTELAESVGFACRFLGSAISVHEMSLLPERFRALEDPHLREESRTFLNSTTLDDRGLPVHDGQLAGVDAVYELVPS